MRHIHSILIPVDFSGNTSLALAKATHIFPTRHALTIHLFHVQSYRSQQAAGSDIKNAQKLEHLKQGIRQQHPSWEVLTWIGSGKPVQDSIITKAQQLNVDLIIIGKSSRHSFFSFFNTVAPGKLAFSSSKPVLTVKPDAINNAIRTVVIPIDGQSPQNKLSVLEALTFHSAIIVRLVTYKDKKDLSPDGRQLIFDTFQAFKIRSHYQVSFETISGKNRVGALLRYCEQVAADLLIVYCDVKTRAGRRLNSQISELIQKGSGTQVLSLPPP